MPTALIIDHDPKLCETISEILKEEFLGSICYCAQSGVEAVEIAKEHPPDLILLSLFLNTEMPADQILQKIKSIRPKVKVIILSGSDFELAYIREAATMQRVKELGWDAYLVKGERTDELINTIKKFFQETHRD